jgi:hypothetical protein
MKRNALMYYREEGGSLLTGTTFLSPMNLKENVKFMTTKTGGQFNMQKDR